MELQRKVKKLGLKPLTDKLRYEFALDKRKVNIYNQYDYYREGSRLGYEFFSKEYLEQNKLRKLKKESKRNNFKGIIPRLRLWFFKLEMW